jgi:hypothetical protein
MQVSFLVYFSNLKMEAICSSETSADIQQTTWHFIPEDNALIVFTSAATVLCSFGYELWPDLFCSCRVENLVPASSFYETRDLSI